MTFLGFKGKKAQASDNIMTPIILLFVFGVITLIGTLLSYAIISEYEALFPTNTDILTTAASFKGVYKIFDYATFLMAIGFIIGIAVTSYRIRALPIYFVVTLITGIFYSFIAYIFSYMFSQIASNSAFVSILYVFPITILVLTNLHWIALFLILVSAIALYGKRPVEAETLR